MFSSCPPCPSVKCSYLLEVDAEIERDVSPRWCGASRGCLATIPSNDILASEEFSFLEEKTSHTSYYIRMAPKSRLLKMLTTLKLEDRRRTRTEAFHQCIRLHGFWISTSPVDALEVIVVDKDHITSRVHLYDHSYGGIRMRDNSIDVLTSAIYSIRV